MLGQIYPGRKDLEVWFLHNYLYRLYSVSTLFISFIIMITEALKLLALGMVTVYIFLTVLMLFIRIFAAVIKRRTPAPALSPGTGSARDNDLIAVFSAAVSAYRNKNSKK